MLKRELIDTATIEDGETLELFRHGRDYMIVLGRNELMSTRMRFSEEQLAELTLDRLTLGAPRILIGGYGMGFTLRAALARLGDKADVVVAEISPKIIEWARGPMKELTQDCLKDRRMTLAMGDVGIVIDEAANHPGKRFDAILLDVDNGPDGLVREDNDRLYSRTGLGKARDALKPGGILSVWSAAPDPAFRKRLKEAGFRVEQKGVRSRPGNKGAHHTIWFAAKR